MNIYSTKIDTFILGDLAHLTHKVSVIARFVFITKYAAFTSILNSYTCDTAVSCTALCPTFRPMRFLITELLPVSYRSIAGRIH